jgi:hypothetical protein
VFPGGWWSFLHAFRHAKNHPEHYERQSRDRGKREINLIVFGFLTLTTPVARVIMIWLCWKKFFA